MFSRKKKKSLIPWQVLRISIVWGEYVQTLFKLWFKKLSEDSYFKILSQISDVMFLWSWRKGNDNRKIGSRNMLTSKMWGLIVAQLPSKKRKFP